MVTVVVIVQEKIVTAIAMVIASHTARVASRTNIQKEEGARVVKQLPTTKNGILVVPRVVVLPILVMALSTVMMAG